MGLKVAPVTFPTCSEGDTLWKQAPVSGCPLVQAHPGAFLLGEYSMSFLLLLLLQLRGHLGLSTGPGKDSGATDSPVDTTWAFGRVGSGLQKAQVESPGSPSTPGGSQEFSSRPGGRPLLPLIPLPFDVNGRKD